MLYYYYYYINIWYILQAEGGYQWTCLAVGLRANVDKYFRYLDFDRTDGKISQRGFKVSDKD